MEIENSQNIIAQIPIKKIINSKSLNLDTRIRYLNKDDISELIKFENVEFVIAEIGKPFLWIEKDIFKFWKEELKNHIANPNEFFVEDFENEYAYIASLWSENPYIVLLEKHH